MFNNIQLVLTSSSEHLVADSAVVDTICDNVICDYAAPINDE